ncbi:riboflavin synthase alpha chain [Caldanaerobius fijiensis DSM 17918]|uniref:Riboflavin synthase n=1 Tax=Caldanaerobius fijiensis DSM 17918 TaxID=1121256 RepID=A0A1M4VZ50_9THEO|nr:riboflavin synthase [Caldanaerobius fijiensis]SHE74258.1 riboflavin synthase alpha chain [Caldanaerobius fijiensis DSM 17918]
MFTGIIEEIGIVKEISAGKNTKISIICSKVLDSTNIGDSIAVNGVCLTVTEKMNDGFTADIMPETYNTTTLSIIKKGDRVNLERALSLAGRLGGHIVTGHVDGIGTIVNKVNKANAVIFKITLENQLLKYIAHKGSVAVDGISLTVVEAGTSYFTVSTIPHTLKETTLSFKKIGDKVNVETDILAKYLERLTGFKDTYEILKDHGYLSDFTRE